MLVTEFKNMSYMNKENKENLPGSFGHIISKDGAVFSKNGKAIFTDDNETDTEDFTISKNENFTEPRNNPLLNFNH